MRFFKRDSLEPVAPADFWTWWLEARDRVARAIATGGLDKRLIEDLSAEAATLNAEEDDLIKRLGSVALFAGRVTALGQRTMHFVAEVPDQMRPAIDGWAAALPDSVAEGLTPRRIKVNFNRDMAWSSLKEIGVG